MKTPILLVLLTLVFAGCRRGDSLIVVSASGQLGAVQQLGVVLTAENLQPVARVRKFDIGYPSVTLPTSFGIEMPATYSGPVKIDLGAISVSTGSSALVGAGSATVSISPGNEYRVTILLGALSADLEQQPPIDLATSTSDGLQPGDDLAAPTHEPRDMAPERDMAHHADMAPERDMAHHADMARPVDMAHHSSADMTVAGRPCTQDSQCDPAHQIGCDQTGHCNACGYSLDALCCIGMSCSFLPSTATNGGPQAFSCQPNNQGGGNFIYWCQNCGGFAQPCCPTSPACVSPYSCQSTNNSCG